MLLLAVAVLLTGCSTSAGRPPPPSPSPGGPASSGQARAASPDADAALSWGPTRAELAASRAEVARWDAERLVGQVIVGRYHGTDPAAAASLVRRLHLAGLCLTGANIATAAQVRATTAAVHAAVRDGGRDVPAVIGVDQEGGTTAHLGSLAAAFPAFMSAGAAVAGARARGVPAEGEQAVTAAYQALALEVRGLGFTWVFAPVADVTIGPADPTIGTRASSDDPAVAAAATAAAIRGFTAAAVVPTVKHFPGHGSVTEDSHTALPVQRADAGRLAARDLVPFVAAARAGAPAVMMSHVAVPALTPGAAVSPASLTPSVYAALRRDVGFDGVVITDSLGMGAVRRGGDPAVRALAAGADLLLMPADTEASHAALVAALASGTLARERVTEAAAKVLALQRRQARRIAAVPVPAAVHALAQKASHALSGAAVTQVSGVCPIRPQRAVRVVAGSAADRATFAAAARAAGLGLGSGPTLALVGSGSARADIVVALGWPMVLARSHGAVAEYALYGRTPGAFAVLATTLLRGGAAPGALPVGVDGAPAASGCG